MRIERETCSGLVIDIQEKLLPHMDQPEELVRRCRILIGGLQLLQVPLLATEQYPKGLGPTAEPVREAMEKWSPVKKMSFSCCGEAGVMSALGDLGRLGVILCGIEAHVCVLQTAIDLISHGYLPVVVADCISSRSPTDKEVALERMRSEGAVVTTSESILFELTGVAGSDEFREISRLIK